MSSKMISLLLIISYAALEWHDRGLASVAASQCNKPNEEYSTKALGFSWSTCGSSSESIQVQSLSLLPDPLMIPGNVYLETNFTINTTESHPLPLSINAKKKVLWVWVPIPCEKSIGSCSYADICQLVAKFQCPKAFKKYGIPCQCPLPKGVYNLPTSLVLDIDKSILPSWLESGEYKARAQLSDNKSNEVLCIDLSLTVGTKLKSIDFIDDFNGNNV